MVPGWLLWRSSQPQEGGCLATRKAPLAIPVSLQERSQTLALARVGRGGRREGQGDKGARGGQREKGGQRGRSRPRRSRSAGPRRLRPHLHVNDLRSDRTFRAFGKVQIAHKPKRPAPGCLQCRCREPLLQTAGWQHRH